MSNLCFHLITLFPGHNYGMGKIRKNELYSSCKVLGIDEGRVIITRHSSLPDCKGAKWPIELISHLILYQVELYNIDTLITFDKHGVSRHLNHCSIYHAMVHLILEKKLPSCKDLCNNF